MKASQSPLGVAIWVVEWRNPKGQLLYVAEPDLNSSMPLTETFADARDFGSRANAEQFHRLWMGGFPGSKATDHEWMMP